MSVLHSFYFKLKDIDELKSSVESTASKEFIEDLNLICQNIKQKEVAKKLRVSESYLSKFRNGKKKVNYLFLARYIKCKERYFI